MALLKLDIKQMEMKVEVGVLEEYKPDKEVRRLYKEFQKLKEESESKVKEFTKKENAEEAGEVLKSNEKVQIQWMTYLKDEFNPKLTDLLKSIRSKNEKICPGYKQVVKNSGKDAI